MLTASTAPIEEIEEQPTKKRKQVFHRAIKRDYHRQKFYQKTR